MTANSRPQKSGIFLYALVVAAFLTPSLAASADHGRIIRVVRGQSIVERHPGVRQVAVGDARIADVKVVSQGQDLLISGVRAGMTSLSIWTAAGKQDVQIRVLDEDPRLLADDLEQILAGIPGVEIRVVGQRVLIRGQVLRERDWDRVQIAANLFPSVLNFVEPNAVEVDRLIRLSLQIIELSRGDLIEAGMRLPSTIGAELSSSWQRVWDSALGGLSGNVLASTELFAGLDLLESRGRARIIARPAIVSRNGQAARFHAGGELPVPVAAGLGQVQVEWKHFGLRFDVTPRVDRTGFFDLEMSIEVSDLDYGNAVASDAGTVPALRTRGTEARVSLREGESLILAELHDRRESKTVGKVPGLGSLPILGELFRRRSLRDQETEVYIVLTPTLVSARDPDTERLQDIGKRYEEAAEEVRPQWRE